MLRKRKERLIQSLDDQIRGGTFSFVAEVVDSRLSMHTPTESGAPSNRDFDTFSLTLRYQPRPALLPATLQARIGDLGRVLEPKDQVVLRCGVGNLDDKIGEFTLGYANSVITTDCSILAVEQLKAALPQSLFVEPKKPTPSPTRSTTPASNRRL